MAKPSDVFDREHEWSALERFASSERAGATLGLVYGRRRQGKTYLLEALVEVVGGTYVTALEQSAAQNLARFAAAYQRAEHTQGRIVFASWEEALSALLSLDGLVVIDELPYLLQTAPELPSVLQALLSPRSPVARQSRTRLVLCGSALSTMRGLLAGSAPLRGRAALELMVHPFSFHDAARYWGTALDPELSVMLHALVGGTPAYLDMCGSAPSSVSEFDDWVVTTLLDPASAMFREGSVLLAEEPRITDAAVYFSVLGAISEGATRRGEIAATVGRPETALGHALKVLTETQLVLALDDALKRRRTTYHIAEPVLRFHQLVVAPNEARLVRHRSAEVWEEVSDTVLSRIYGPHFEHLARAWCTESASATTLGGTASQVAPSVVACIKHREGHEVDVVVLENKPHAKQRIIAIGEAKWRSAPMDTSHLERLIHVRDLLDVTSTRLLCFSKSGFTPALVSTARDRSDVELVDLTRIYDGD